VSEPSKDKLHDTAALRALVDGDDETGASPPESDDALPAGMQADPDRAQPEMLRKSPAAPGGLPGKPAPRRGQPTRGGGGKNHHTFRIFAIPLLLLMSAGLGYAAMWTLREKASRDASEIEENVLLSNAGLFATLSFVLAAVLLLGAAYFGFELARHRKAR
jgi:hypothetical protein